MSSFISALGNPVSVTDAGSINKDLTFAKVENLDRSSEISCTPLTGSEASRSPRTKQRSKKSDENLLLQSFEADALYVILQRHDIGKLMETAIEDMHEKLYDNPQKAVLRTFHLGSSSSSHIAVLHQELYKNLDLLKRWKWRVFGAEPLAEWNDATPDSYRDESLMCSQSLYPCNDFFSNYAESWDDLKATVGVVLGKSEDVKHSKASLITITQQKSYLDLCMGVAFALTVLNPDAGLIITQANLPPEFPAILSEFFGSAIQYPEGIVCSRFQIADESIGKLLQSYQSAVKELLKNKRSRLVSEDFINKNGVAEMEPRLLADKGLAVRSLGVENDMLDGPNEPATKKRRYANAKEWHKRPAFVVPKESYPTKSTASKPFKYTIHFGNNLTAGGSMSVGGSSGSTASPKVSSPRNSSSRHGASNPKGVSTPTRQPSKGQCTMQQQPNDDLLLHVSSKGNGDDFVPSLTKGNAEIAWWQLVKYPSEYNSLINIPTVIMSDYETALKTTPSNDKNAEKKAKDDWKKWIKRKSSDTTVPIRYSAYADVNLLSDVSEKYKEVVGFSGSPVGASSEAMFHITTDRDVKYQTNALYRATGPWREVFSLLDNNSKDSIGKASIGTVERFSNQHLNEMVSGLAGRNSNPETYVSVVDLVVAGTSTGMAHVTQHFVSSPLAFTPVSPKTVNKADGNTLLNIATSLEDLRDGIIAGLDQLVSNSENDSSAAGRAEGSYGLIVRTRSRLLLRSEAALILALSTVFQKVGIYESTLCSPFVLGGGERFLVFLQGNSREKIQDLASNLRRYRLSIGNPKLPCVNPRYIYTGSTFAAWLSERNSMALKSERESLEWLMRWKKPISNASLQGPPSELLSSDLPLEFMQSVEFLGESMKYFLNDTDSTLQYFVYFGTFNPLHENHFYMVKRLVQDKGTAQVLLFPNDDGNVFKQKSMLSLAHRIEMLKIRCLAEGPEFCTKVRIVTSPPRTGGDSKMSTTNWPGRLEYLAELEKALTLQNGKLSRVGIMLGEDSWRESLHRADNRKQSGIYTFLKRLNSKLETEESFPPPQVIIFPRSLEKYQQGLKSDVRGTNDKKNFETEVGRFAIGRNYQKIARYIEDYEDPIASLSSSELRKKLREDPKSIKSNELHPKLVDYIVSGGNVAAVNASSSEGFNPPRGTNKNLYVELARNQPISNGNAGMDIGEGDNNDDEEDDEANTMNVDMDPAPVTNGKSDNGKSEISAINAVRAHYDKQASSAAQQKDRKDSTSTKQRNTHNTLKNLVVLRYAELIKKEISKQNSTGSSTRQFLSILDLACGKGGDLQKYHQACCFQILGVDISSVSLKEALRRIQNYVCPGSLKAAKHGLVFNKKFYSLDEASQLEVKFVAEDCFSKLLNWEDPELKSYGVGRVQPSGPSFHLTSCMFAAHYAFTSEQRVRVLLENASSRLAKGGIFFGVIPNAEVILKRCKPIGNSYVWGSEYFRVEFSEEDWERTKSMKRNLYDINYTFSFSDAVEKLAEPLLDLENFATLAKEYDLVTDPELQMNVNQLLKLAGTTDWGTNPDKPMPKDHAQVTNSDKQISDNSWKSVETSAGGDMARLMRNYWYDGGIASDLGDLYTTFAFRKTTGVSAFELNTAVSTMVANRKHRIHTEIMGI